ncbi:MAG TPA: type II toxin-antitoxin system VapC family toxin [Candidatus Dormibacteraeota bacterium]|nr:type II toxin-antitoxin system VapC family toxin [Candidatus Dormibacteraeota bacterium]
MAEVLVLETSACLDLLIGTREGQIVRQALLGHPVHVSDHVGVEVAMALRELTRQQLLPTSELDLRIRLLATAPFTTHSSGSLLPAAVSKSGLRLGDALCVALSELLAAPLVTTDARLGTVWPRCWLIAVPVAEFRASSQFDSSTPG